MKNKDKWFEVVTELKVDNAKKQKRGLHFIMTSVLIWIAIFFINSSNLHVLEKNMFTLFCSMPLVPVAFLISKIIKVDFQNKENPLTSLGIIFSVNQILYILIAMWVYSSMPEKMVMVYAMIFGAHLLPYGWLYRSKTYYASSIIIPVTVLAVGLRESASVIAAMMIGVELLLCACLALEVRKDRKDPIPKKTL